MEYTFTKIADNIPGAEGPIFDLSGRFFVVSPNDGSVIQINEITGKKTEHANTGGMPAGLQVDRNNHLWVADMKLGILCVSPDGAIEHTVKQYDDKPIRGCNDCALDSGDNLYFSAPAGSTTDNPVGELFCRTADGQVSKLDDGYAFSNGLAVTQDDQTLIVAETWTKMLWAYNIDAPGQISGKQLFATLPGEHRGGPDGMDFDITGQLLVANWGGGSIDVFDTQGKLAKRIRTPFDKPSNIHFGGQDGKTLVVTEHTNHAVWEITWQYPGLRTVN